MKNFKYFENETAYNAERNGNYREPWVSWTEERGLDWNKDEEERLRSMPFTMEILDTGNITWNLYARTIQYSKNGGDWTTMDKDTSISVLEGDEVSFKGTGLSGVNNILSTAQFNVKGNIRSLINGDEFANVDNSVTITMSGFFKNCTTIISAENLILPATTMAYEGYSEMFYGCTNLTTPPVLPATTLATYCYESMFRNCTSLTTAPELPATTLVNYCYYYMFSGCTSLTTPPVLPATTLAGNCYYNMFSGCTSLTEAPELPVMTLVDSCYLSMFKDCTSLTTAPELPATTAVRSCYASMFSGCTSLTTPPVLPSTSLEYGCYQSMFSGCTSLTTAPELPATTLANYCYSSMFNGCTSLTAAPVLPATTLVSGCYQSMFRGCSNLHYIKAMFILQNGYTTDWVRDVSSTGTFVKNAAAQWNDKGYSGVPYGQWTVETATE